MKNIEILPSAGNFYKANLHCHTTISDGHLTKEEVKEAYMKEGYSVIAFTDHRTYGWHPELDDENFLAIAGFEADLNEPMKPGDFNHTRTYHINFYDQNPSADKKGIQPESVYGDLEGLNNFLAEREKEGFLICYNHPYWSLQNYTDFKDLEHLWGMEIYNYGCEHDGLYGYNPQSYDEMLRTGKKLFCVATDDNHNSYPFGHPLCDSFGGFTMIKAPKLTYSSIIEALKAGNFYFSMGPEIHEAKIEDGVLHVKTSPVEKIYVIEDGRNTYKKLAYKGETITEASFELKGTEKYIRIVVEDGKRLSAGTNPCYLQD